MNHEEWLERAEIYALGALDGAELSQFEAHLAAGCSLCETQVRRLDERARGLSAVGAGQRGGARADLGDKYPVQVPLAVAKTLRESADAVAVDHAVGDQPECAPSHV